jgi:hypothetical protein
LRHDRQQHQHPIGDMDQAPDVLRRVYPANDSAALKVAFIFAYASPSLTISSAGRDSLMITAKACSEIANCLAVRSGVSDMCYCLTPDPSNCKYSEPFQNHWFCFHPDRLQIADNFAKKKSVSK